MFIFLKTKDVTHKLPCLPSGFVVALNGLFLG